MPKIQNSNAEKEKEQARRELPNLLEVADTKEANKINLQVYKVRFSDSRNAWMFQKRAKYYQR